MKIAMIGSGAAGSVFAAYLKKGGADMYLVDRYKMHMDKIASEGLLFKELGQEYLLHGFHTAASAEEIGVMDAVILMVKCNQTDDIMPSVLPCIGPDTIVISLQNGLCNQEVLSKYVEEERIILGFGKIGTELPEPGVCVGKPEPGVSMYFGAVKNNPKVQAMGVALEELFQAGGCNAAFVDDIQLYIWRKAISNCGYNTVCAVLGLPVGAVLRSQQGNELVMGVWKECCDVAKALGIGDLWHEMEEERERLLEGFSDYYPSMAQDIIRHRQTEIMHMNGAIVSFGERLGIPTPLNHLLKCIILTIQENFDLKK